MIFCCYNLFITVVIRNITQQQGLGPNDFLLTLFNNDVVYFSFFVSDSERT